MKRNEILTRVDKLNLKARSAWRKGVFTYAYLLLWDLKKDKVLTAENCQHILLNGARNWKDYSEKGMAFVYDGDIAETLCTPSELKKTKDGRRRPNRHESWLDVQARALYQAYFLIYEIISGRK